MTVPLSLAIRKTMSQSSFACLLEVLTIFEVNSRNISKVPNNIFRSFFFLSFSRMD